MQAQVLVNESWSTQFATPSGAGWSASATGDNGNIYTIGHSLSSGLPQLWLSCHDEDGNLLWSSGLDASGLSSIFGAALLASASEEVRLAVEDIEHILEYTATDLDSANYDQKTGWGRLNAGAALELINEARILHFSAEPEAEIQCDHSLTNAACVIEMQGPYLESETGFAVNAGDVLYRTDTKRYIWDINLDVCALTNDPNATIVHSAEKPGYWVRNSANTLWGQPDTSWVTPPTDGIYGVLPYKLVQFAEEPVIDGCTFQGELTGYSYAIYDNETGENLEAIMPAGLAHCESPRLAISLLVRSENPVSANEAERPDWRLFPNPTSGEITLEGIATGYLDVRLFSINGQQLAQLFQGNYQGSSTLELKIPDIPPGIYVCRIQSGREFFSKKLIKH